MEPPCYEARFPPIGSLGHSGQIVDFREKDPNSPSTLNNASIYVIETRLLKELDLPRTEAELGVERPFYDFGKHVFPACWGTWATRTSRATTCCGAWSMMALGLMWGKNAITCASTNNCSTAALEVDLPLRKASLGILGNRCDDRFQTVTIVPPVVIGNGCVIEPGVVLGPYAVVGDDWIVKRNARISHSVLWERYPMFRTDGSQMTADEMRRLDRHEVGANVTIESSIVTGGSIGTSVRESTIEMLEDGQVSICPLDAPSDGGRVYLAAQRK